MTKLGLEKELVNREVWERTVDRFVEAGVLLPTLAQLAEPHTIPASIQDELEGVDPDSAHPRNLFRVHWYNSADRRGVAEVPGHLVLPSSLTGVEAKIVVATGGRFPMIGAHKVLAAFGCLVPRLVTGQFDPTADRAIWPSTGNYCRGGVAISSILGCHGVAVLPEGMSQERFDWLAEWVVSPDDVLRTPGTESNVKEIYDACDELDKIPENVIFNQFCEFGNHLVHYRCTGMALSDIFEHLRKEDPELRLAAYISATGSGGTLAAGDWLKDTYDSLTVAVEALECPTLLYNGFGEHNIQGIGDKHIPLIHNVMQTDAVTAVSDVVTDTLYVLLNSEAGREYLVTKRGVPQALIEELHELGLSGICNVIAAIKTAKYYGLGAKDVLLTIATDSGAMYHSEGEKALDKHFGGSFDVVDAGETFGRGVLGCTVDHFQELSRVDKDRIFNLGYYTWVEQQGVTLQEFQARRDQRYWVGLRPYLEVWDRLIEDLNGAVLARSSR